MTLKQKKKTLAEKISAMEVGSPSVWVATPKERNYAQGLARSMVAMGMKNIQLVSRAQHGGFNLTAIPKP